jgi:hypothetical protein
VGAGRGRGRSRRAERDERAFDGLPVVRAYRRRKRGERAHGLAVEGPDTPEVVDDDAPVVAEGVVAGVRIGVKHAVRVQRPDVQLEERNARAIARGLRRVGREPVVERLSGGPPGREHVRSTPGTLDARDTEHGVPGEPPRERLLAVRLEREVALLEHRGPRLVDVRTEGMCVVLV